MDWKQVLHNSNIEYAYSIFSIKLNSIYNKHFPVKTFKLKHDNRKTWLTSAIINSIKLKNKLYIK